MTFRHSRGDDYFASYLRRYVFQKLPQREVPLEMFLSQANEGLEASVLLTDDDNPLPKWQDEDAAHHWQCESIEFVPPRPVMHVSVSNNLGFCSDERCFTGYLLGNILEARRRF